MKRLFMALVLSMLLVGTAFAAPFNNNFTEPSYSETSTATKTAAYTVTSSDNGKIIRVTASTANITITLPAISTLSNSFGIKILKTDATKYIVTVTRASSDTIDGATSYVITKQNDFVMVRTDVTSTDWDVQYADEIISANVASGTVTIGGALQLNQPMTNVNIDDTTNAVVDVITMDKQTTGTAAAGLGAGLSIKVEDAGGSEEQASMDVVLTDVTDAAEDADFVFSNNTAGTIAETLRIDADSSATTGDKLTFTSNTTETDGVVDVVILKATTGTAAANFGIGLAFQPEDAGGSFEDHVTIDAILTDATDTTEDADLVVTQNVNGTMEERVRFDADGSQLVLNGTTPAMTVGDAGAEDTKIVFDGNAEDYHIGIYDTDDDLVIGLGSTLGTTPVITISDSGSAVPTVTLTGELKDAEVHTVSDTLTLADCGKVHFLSHASTAIILTLPAPTLGCELKFVTALAFSDQHEIRTPGATNIIEGTLQVNAADVACTVEDTIEFADTAETLGDFMELISDGTTWFIQDSIADTAAAIACTTA